MAHKDGHRMVAAWFHNEIDHDYHAGWRLGQNEER